MESIIGRQIRLQKNKTKEGMKMLLETTITKTFAVSEFKTIILHDRYSTDTRLNATGGDYDFWRTLCQRENDLGEWAVYHKTSCEIAEVCDICGAWGICGCEEEEREILTANEIIALLQRHPYYINQRFNDYNSEWILHIDMTTTNK